MRRLSATEPEDVVGQGGHALRRAGHPLRWRPPFRTCSVLEPVAARLETDRPPFRSGGQLEIAPKIGQLLDLRGKDRGLDAQVLGAGNGR